MGVRQWRKKAEDRREWGGIMKEAKVKLKRTIWPKKIHYQIIHKQEE
jgi:hypothetical protein